MQQDSNIGTGPGDRDRATPLLERRRGKSRIHAPAKSTASLVDLAAPQIVWLTSDEPLVPAGGNQTVSYLFIKRSMDIVGAICIAAIASPVIILTVLALLATCGRPLYVQQRVGLCGRRFKMYKFRSMALDADDRQHLVENEQGGPVFKNRRDPRVTRIGRMIRSTSIDELPQLWNVLRGEMSLVGPRPLPAQEIARCSNWQLQRLAVKPGLTCKWQVSGRCQVPFDEWIRMDLWYVKRQSVWIDLVLLVKTPWCVLTRRGAY